MTRKQQAQLALAAIAARSVNAPNHVYITLRYADGTANEVRSVNRATRILTLRDWPIVTIEFGYTAHPAFVYRYPVVSA